MMWLGSRFTAFETRYQFIQEYLIASGFKATHNDVHAFMLDCEVNIIVAFPGLLAHIYDAEAPLSGDVKHPTAKVREVSGPDASPTGLELVDLLTNAIEQV